MTIYGYARVSTGGQSLAAQIAELKAANCEKICQEKISGAKADRKQLARLVGVLAKGDLLIVTRLDSLARSTLHPMETITKAGAAFKSLGDAWVNTTTAQGRLLVTILGSLAEFERHLIHSRTSEGRKRAIARGVVMGRKPKLTSHQKKDAIRRRRAGENLVDIGRSYNVSHSTISRLTSKNTK